MLPAILSLGGLGLLFAFGLGLAARKFAVKVDPRIEKIAEILPGVNCGACGFPNCQAVAAALIEGKIESDSCVLVEEEALRNIAEILGQEVKVKEKKVARLICQGGKDQAKEKYVYQGVRECRVANLLFGGEKACAYGCLGLGTCVQECPFGAIALDENNLPLINEDKCTGCRKCVEVCPKEVLTLIPKPKKVWIACNSRAKGAQVKKVCQEGCIGCGLCLKACKPKAITLENNLARIDYQKCTNCGDCVEKCPTKAITCCL
ncbi:RnfABCDGE type electron transport complex subunit B [candidate division NPL-UPA2 bacterium]|nr:RnfABCDGE type electron transport complex subunit B [candidate division NPL-UPA2 bacterium]